MMHEMTAYGMEHITAFFYSLDHLTVGSRTPE